MHGGTWKCFPEIHPKSCSLTCFLKSIYNAFKCWWFQTFCDPCYMAYSYFEEIETILWVWKIVFWGWEGSPLPCTSSSVKPVSASTSKTCQGEANLGRIHFLNTRTPTRIHAHHHKQSPLHADTWSLQIIPAPPWLEKIRESWKMPLWKRNHLLTFAHFKRYHRCCDEVIECNANKHKKMMKAIWSWSYDNLKAPFITYRSPQSNSFWCFYGYKDAVEYVTDLTLCFGGTGEVSGSQNWSQNYIISAACTLLFKSWSFSLMITKAAFIWSKIQ